MTKFSVFLIACTLAGIGCEDKSGAAPDKPAAAPVGTETKSEAQRTPGRRHRPVIWRRRLLAATLNKDQPPKRKQTLVQ